MKKVIIVVLAILICGFTACVPDYKGPAPPKEKTPVVSSGVVLPNGTLPDGGVFPDSLIKVWLESKRAELARYNQFPAPIEFELYYHL